MLRSAAQQAPDRAAARLSTSCQAPKQQPASPLLPARAVPWPRTAAAPSAAAPPWCPCGRPGTSSSTQSSWTAAPRPAARCACPARHARKIPEHESSKCGRDVAAQGRDETLAYAVVVAEAEATQQNCTRCCGPVQPITGVRSAQPWNCHAFQVCTALHHLLQPGASKWLVLQC